MFRRLFFDPFRLEKALLAGTPRNSSTQASILHFSFNKAATQTVKKLLIDCGLDALLTTTGIELPRSLRLEFLLKHEMRQPKGENGGKLQAGTTQKLNCILEVPLNCFNYPM